MVTMVTEKYQKYQKYRSMTRAYVFNDVFNTTLYDTNKRTLL